MTAAALLGSWMGIARAAEPVPTDADARNKAVVQNAFERWARGEPGFFEALLSPDARWTIAGFGAEGATYSSRRALIDEAVAPLARRLRTPIRPTVHDIWADGGVVIVHWSGEAIARDGRPYRNRYVWMLTLRDGRATDVVAYLDMQAYNDVLRRIEED